jgi:hypothetical protein
MLNRTDKNEYSHLVLNFKEKLCSVSPLSIIFPSMHQDHKTTTTKKEKVKESMVLPKDILWGNTGVRTYNFSFISCIILHKIWKFFPTFSFRVLLFLMKTMLLHDLLALMICALCPVL